MPGADAPGPLLLLEAARFPAPAPHWVLSFLPPVVELRARRLLFSCERAPRSERPRIGEPWLLCGCCPYRSEFPWDLRSSLRRGSPVRLHALVRARHYLLWY